MSENETQKNIGRNTSFLGVSEIRKEKEEKEILTIMKAKRETRRINKKLDKWDYEDKKQLFETYIKLVNSGLSLVFERKLGE